MEYALWLLSRKRYTVAELKKKLLLRIKKYALADNPDAVINRCIEWKYLNDEEYACDYVKNRLQMRPRGVRLLKLELRKKGIESSIIQKAAEGIEVDERQLAENLARKKISLLQRFPLKKRREKLFRFLSSRGFSYETIEAISPRLAGPAESDSERSN